MEHFSKTLGVLDIRKKCGQNITPLGGQHRTCFYSIKKFTTGFVLCDTRGMYEMAVNKLFILLVTIVFGKRYLRLGGTEVGLYLGLVRV